MTHAGEALRFAGVLSRGHVATLWKALPKSLAGVRRIDLADVAGIDSSGVAMLAEVAARCANGVAVQGGPDALVALRSAYRMDETLGFSSS